MAHMMITRRGQTADACGNCRTFSKRWLGREVVRTLRRKTGEDERRGEGREGGAGEEWL